MNSFSSFCTLNYPCDRALAWLNQSLSQNGLRVLQTFDLHDARLGLHDCTCPNHGTDQCDCQMVVLLVYGNTGEPVTLILHGSDGQTWISLVNNSIQHADHSVQAVIEHALQQNPSE